MRHGLTVKNSILRKVLPPESRSVYQVAKESGISPATIHSWMLKVKEGKLEVTPEGSDPSPKDWPPAQKFRLLMEGKLIPAEQRGEWLRINGLHSEYLALLEEELTNLMTDKQETLKAENKALKKKVLELEKAGSWKDKPMAEVVALLVLKKNWRRGSGWTWRTKFTRSPAGFGLLYSRSHYCRSPRITVLQTGGYITT